MAKQAPSPLRIEDHAVVGDMHSAALVGLDGTVDFLCFPRFDSPPVFDHLLDPERGGYFQVEACVEQPTRHQLYLPDTNVLITRALGAGGIVEIVDFMSVDCERVVHCLVRRISVVRGETTVRVRCRPRFDYGRSGHEVRREGDGHALFVPDRGPPLRLHVPGAWREEDGAVVAELRLRAGEHADVILAQADVDGPGAEATEGFADRAFERTVRYWRRWVARGRYRGRWRGMVHRSSLLLKLLTFRAEGAIVAAPTFGLPEAVGGKRNWDYRYTWIRDASLCLREFLALGYTEEVEAFIAWLTGRCGEAGESGELRAVHTIDGRPVPRELTLDHYAGYRGSRPVRIGNDAYDQLQIDAYGELLMAIERYDALDGGVSHEDWAYVGRLVDWVAEHWTLPDESIWEVRGGRYEFCYSRVMSWVALHRALRVARRAGRPAPVARWRETRDAIYAQVHQDFFDREHHAFVAFRGARGRYDAATLLMPQVGFIGGRDPRWLSTLAAIDDQLVEDALVYRYRAEGDMDPFGSVEGSFSVCSFWFVECLARAGQVDRARLLFEKMLGYANHVGLYAEELGATGDQLGNFPQALTHIGLITAAQSLDHALDQAREVW